MRSLGIFMVFILLSTFALAQEKSNYISKIDFDPVGNEQREEGEIFSTYSELKIWAYYQGWNLDPDIPFGGIQNGIARMIPPSGFRHVFLVPGNDKETLYLHMDVTRYTPGTKEILRPNILKVYVNGRWKESIEVFGKKNFQNPVIIPLDPSEYPDGRVILELEPVSSNKIGKFWGVWDIFLSKWKEDNRY